MLGPVRGVVVIRTDRSLVSNCVRKPSFFDAVTVCAACIFVGVGVGGVVRVGGFFSSCFCELSKA